MINELDPTLKYLYSNWTEVQPYNMGRGLRLFSQRL